ncbi:MAG: sel1 repeat family protein, partial [Alphaproteobacteria bacterium]|nr:sel1 repeat family protein [Alphaproteobacteria bacterium]
YDDGQGVTQDYKEAAKWYLKAAKQGYAKAQFNLGVKYDDGQGVTQDYKEAAKWYLKAAKQGYAKAQINLGFMFGKGTGVLQDSVVAHMWSNIAGANGSKLGAKNRAKIEKKMTPAQIAEAQKLAKECMKSKYKKCGQ